MKKPSFPSILLRLATEEGFEYRIGLMSCRASETRVWDQGSGPEDTGLHGNPQWHGVETLPSYMAWTVPLCRLLSYEFLSPDGI